MMSNGYKLELSDWGVPYGDHLVYWDFDSGHDELFVLTPTGAMRRTYDEKTDEFVLTPVDLTKELIALLRRLEALGGGE